MMVGLPIWLFSEQARAHGGAVPVRGVYDWSDLPALEPGAWIVWEFFPSIVLGCLAWLAAYAYMAGPARRRWNLATEGPSRKEWTLFVSSLLVVFFSLQGPLHELSDIYLFSGHMVQHLLITLVFPPLFILGIPPWMLRPLVRIPWVQAFGRFVTTPMMAFVISTGVLYLWHIPTMYDWALYDHDVHVVEHITFMASAVIMWWPAWSRVEEIPRLSPGLRMVYLFVLTLPMKALGAIITVSDYLLYEFYAVQPRVFGLDPMMDQRLGGLVMWIPGGLVFWLSIGFTFFGSYYAAVQRQRSGSVPSELPGAAATGS